MKWFEISKTRPPFGQLIWVWDMERELKFLIRYKGSEEAWIEKKDSDKFPIWSYLNEDISKAT